MRFTGWGDGPTTATRTLDLVPGHQAFDLGFEISYRLTVESPSGGRIALDHGRTRRLVP